MFLARLKEQFKKLVFLFFHLQQTTHKSRLGQLLEWKLAFSRILLLYDSPCPSLFMRRVKFDILRTQRARKCCPTSKGCAELAQKTSASPCAQLASNGVASVCWMQVFEEEHAVVGARDPPSTSHWCESARTAQRGGAVAAGSQMGIESQWKVLAVKANGGEARNDLPTVNEHRRCCHSTANAIKSATRRIKRNQVWYINWS